VPNPIEIWHPFFSFLRGKSHEHWHDSLFQMTAFYPRVYIIPGLAPLALKSSVHLTYLIQKIKKPQRIASGSNGYDGYIYIIDNLHFGSLGISQLSHQARSKKKSSTISAEATKSWMKRWGRARLPPLSGAPKIPMIDKDATYRRRPGCGLNPLGLGELCFSSFNLVWWEGGNA